MSLENSSLRSPIVLTCPAKGCSADAVWELRWNNPKLHTPDRRKSWLACEAHRGTLSDFLSARGFLRDVEALDRPTPDSAEPGSA
jgi:hypothetical protein